MSNNQIAHRAAPAPDRITQGTAIEQSRAVAQVQAAVVAARQFPRDAERARAAMLAACSSPMLASRAFFAFPRAGQTVSGASVHLARELARIWGNIDHGVVELSRDDVHGQSEFQAYAWDLETNTRSSRTFIVEHARDAGRRGRQRLTELRDISDNNMNVASRNVREVIFSVLPRAFRDEAEAACQQALEAQAAGEQLAQRADRVVQQFARTKARVGVPTLEAKVGAPRAEWTPGDVVGLEVLYRSLAAGELTVAEAFPPAPVTAAELVGDPEPGDGWVAFQAAAEPVDEPNAEPVE